MICKVNACVGCAKGREGVEEVKQPASGLSNEVLQSDCQRSLSGVLQHKATFLTLKRGSQTQRCV